MVPNSAAVERIFSMFGIVHTKLRNRLGKGKVRKQVLVRSDTARTFGTGSRLKRKFGEESDDDDDEESLQAAILSAARSAQRASGTDGDAIQHDVIQGDSESGDGEAGMEQVNESEAATVDFMATFRDLLHEAETEMDATEQVTDRADITSGPVPDDARLLKNLFRYPQAGETTRSSKILTHYWALGERNLEREAQFHDDAHAAETRRAEEQPRRASERA